MKILFIHDGPIYYDKNGKYYTRSLTGLKERYRCLGDELTILIRSSPLTELTKANLIPSDIRIAAIPEFKRPRLYFSRIREVKEIIEREVKDADILILRGSSAAHIAVKYAKKYKKPYIYECVSCTWDALWNYSLLGKCMAPFAFLNTKRIIKNSPYVYYVTNEFLQRRYPTKGKSISCSNVVIKQVDEAVLRERKKRTSELKKERKIKIGTAAALDVRYKGQEYVIKALPELVKKGYNVEYYLAGGNRLGSTYLHDLAKKLGVEERVIFKGSLTADEMPGFYDSLDIYIQPSKQEGLPRAVIEAMSRGCPALGTNIAGIPELLQPECLFKKGSASAVVSAFERMLSLDLPAVCEQNFERAKAYEKAALQKRRERFYEDFMEDFFR